MGRVLSAVVSFLVLLTASAGAADYPQPRQGELIAWNFRFHTGEVMPELRLAYTTVGESNGQGVLVLHGTTGAAASMLTPAFAGEDARGHGTTAMARFYKQSLADPLQQRALRE